jgi:hypothetical protein
MESEPTAGLFPVDAGNRAGFHGFLNAFHGASLRFKDFRFLPVFIQFEHFGANVFTVAATDAFLFVNDHFLSHQRLRSNGWRDGDQGSQLAFRPQAVRLSNIANKHVPCSSWKGGAVFSKKLTDPFDDDDAYLAFDVVRVNGEFLAWFEIEIDDFEKRGIVHEEPLDGGILKSTRLVETDSLHGGLLSPGYISLR